MKRFLLIALFFVLCFLSNSISTYYGFDNNQNYNISYGYTHICKNYLSNSYYSDNIYHWKVCSICKAQVNKVKHSLTTSYSSNSTYHWKSCSVCKVQVNKIKHTLSSYYHDNSYHWKICTICKVQLYKTNHSLNSSKTACLVCKAADLRKLTGNTTVDDCLKNGKNFYYFREQMSISANETASILNMLNNEIGATNNVYQSIAVLQTMFNISNKYDYSVDKTIKTFFSPVYIAGSGSAYDKSETLNYSKNTLLAFQYVINGSKQSTEVRNIIKNSIAYAGYSDLNMPPVKYTYYHEALSSYIAKGKAFSTKGTVLDCNEKYIHDIFSEVAPTKCAKCKTYISANYYCFKCKNSCCNVYNCYDSSYRRYQVINGVCSNPNKTHAIIK